MLLAVSTVYTIYDFEDENEHHTKLDRIRKIDKTELQRKLRINQYDSPYLKEDEHYNDIIDSLETVEPTKTSSFPNKRNFRHN